MLMVCSLLSIQVWLVEYKSRVGSKDVGTMARSSLQLGVGRVQPVEVKVVLRCPIFVLHVISSWSFMIMMRLCCVA